MCCAMSLVCPSIAIHRTYQFWVRLRTEPVNIPKTIESPAECGVRAVIRFLYSEQAKRDVVLRYCPPSWQILGRTLQLQQKRLLESFRWAVFDHPPSSARTWFPVIFIFFLVWNGRRSTTFWHNKLQNSVENWLKAQVAGFYGEYIEKFVPRHENVYVGASTT